MRPAVAVTAGRRSLNRRYLAALEGAELRVVVLAPPVDPAVAIRRLASARGLVLTGGRDVAPVRYGAAPHPKLRAPQPARDALELALIGTALERGIPVLAICRGLQILNVALRGTLFQDLPSERPGPIRHDDKRAPHAVGVAPESLLQRALGATRVAVNSWHHQAARDLAPPLRATAWADDGLVEGVELDGGRGSTPWVVAVQWHPEELTDRSLFRAFAEAVQ